MWTPILLVAALSGAMTAVAVHGNSSPRWRHATAALDEATSGHKQKAARPTMKHSGSPYDEATAPTCSSLAHDMLELVSDGCHMLCCSTSQAQQFRMLLSTLFGGFFAHNLHCSTVTWVTWQSPSIRILCCSFQHACTHLCLKLQEGCDVLMLAHLQISLFTPFSHCHFGSAR